MVTFLIALGFAVGIVCLVLGAAMEAQRRNPGYVAPPEVWEEEARKLRPIQKREGWGPWHPVRIARGQLPPDWDDDQP